MKNPLKEYKTLIGACKNIGFDVAIPQRFKLKQIFIVDKDILELRFPSLIARKAKYSKASSSNKGISGVYTGAYPNDCNSNEFLENDVSGNLYWNGSAKRPKAYLAVWDDLEHKYSYSVYAPKGINLKSMSKWQKFFR